MNTESLRNLVNIDSPSGFTEEACKYVFDLLSSYGYSPRYTAKGAVVCNLGEQPSLVLAAHVDTLGGIVSKINSDGSLRISNVGGLLLPSFEGSYLRIRTMKNKVYTGTLLLDNPAAHVNKEAANLKRDISNMHVRIDEEVATAEDVQKLGIAIGDFVCFEAYYTETSSGFIKSKFMDNKASCFVLFEIARILQEEGRSAPVQLFFSNYEEVGHGASTKFESSIKEMLCLDMAVVGQGQAGKEDLCSICAKDSSGPYDYSMRKSLLELAEKNNIAHCQDVYPYYGSDGSAALRAGNDLRVALIGMGVSASHGIERTHKKGIQATIDLCLAYIKR
ncbi:MAG: M42 family metallopeptidase [Chitinophagales bacterium]